MAGSARRARLLEMSTGRRIVMVEAPSGAGKSTLLAQLLREHDGPVLDLALTGVSATRGQLVSRLAASLRQHGLSDLTTQLGRSEEPQALVEALRRWSDVNDEQFTLHVDDVHLADEDLDGYLAALCDGWPSPHRIVLAGRRLPERLRGSLVGTDSVLIGVDELRFRPVETRELLGEPVAAFLDDAEVALITRRCEGWAAALSLAAEGLRRAAPDRDAVVRHARELADRGSTVQDLLGDLLRPASKRTRMGVTMLACLPLFDDELTKTAGVDGGIAELVILGLPLADADSGAVCFPGVVREALNAGAPDEGFIEAAAHRYLDLGLTGTALEVLATAGTAEQLARFLVALPPALHGSIDARELAAAVATLPHEVLRDHPSILVLLADIYTVAGQAEAYVESISRAQALLAERDDLGLDRDAEVREVRSAVLARQAIARNDDGLVREMQALLTAPGLPPMARARLSAAVGRAIASRRTASALREGARRLEESARVYQREQAPDYAAAMHAITAHVALVPLGRYDAAIARLDEALVATRGNAELRQAILPYRALALVDVGRYAEAEGHLRELRQPALNGGASNERAAAYARWATARMASQRGDAEATWAACRAVERSEVSVDTGNGAFFLADAAQLLARVGWFEEAERLLAAARERDPGGTHLVTVGEFVVAAHRGDRVRAEKMLAVLDQGRVVEPRDRWRITLLHAQLCHEDGDPLAAPLAAAAFEEAAQLGYAELPLIQEPNLAHGLLEVAAELTASAGDVLAARAGRIRVLGGFDIEVAGVRTEPVGRPAELLAYLTLHDRQANVDQIVEALWADSVPGRGRERLRNVIWRVRRDHGDVLERHGEVVRLRAEVTIDLEEFLDHCRRAVDPLGDRESAAKAALALYRGEPVPGLSYLDWVDRARRHLEDRVLAMHDVAAEEAGADGRLDEALRSVFAALELEPVAEPRYLAAVRLLAEQGRRARALSLLDEARTALGSAQLRPSLEFERLAQYLDRNPALAS